METINTESVKYLLLFIQENTNSVSSDQLGLAEYVIARYRDGVSYLVYNFGTPESGNYGLDGSFYYIPAFSKGPMLGVFTGYSYTFYPLNHFISEILNLYLLNER